VLQCLARGAAAAALEGLVHAQLLQLLLHPL
jgi:hypothetical protein